MITTKFPQLSKLTCEVLRQLIVQALADTHGAHDLIWYFATKYEGGSPVDEINDLLLWLSHQQYAGEEVRPILCATSGKILAKTDGEHIYLWCRRHSAWEARPIQDL